MSYKIKELEWQEGNPARWDGFDVVDPMVIEYFDGRVLIVGMVNLMGGISPADKVSNCFQNIKRWAKLELIPCN